MVAAAASSIIGLEMDADTARHHIERIQEHLTRGNYHLNQARKLILDLKANEGWKVLGYSSWRQCVQAEFETSSASIYRQLNAALVELDLSPIGGIGKYNERVLRPLTKRSFNAEARQTIMQLSEQIVGVGGQVTSGVVEAVITGLEEMLSSGTTQDADGNQQPITEQMSADLIARVRETKIAHKEHMRRMDKQRNYILGGVETEKITRGQLDRGLIAAIMPVDDLQRAKLLEALRSGKPIYGSLWTED
jgi:hypothetical protein